jgi:hypothetical protein
MQRAARSAAVLAIGALSFTGLAATAHAATARPQANVQVDVGNYDNWDSCNYDGSAYVEYDGAVGYACDPAPRGTWELYVEFD